MNKAKKILLDNAYSSWRKAIFYCDLILSGRSTFDNRKNFVSALHNATELFLKQIMLDNNDHRVAKLRRSKEESDNLTYRFDSATDLNEFFKSLSNAERDEFRSIKFNQLLDLHTKLLADFFSSGENFTNELKTLGRLRNNETHFFIDTQTYLTEAEFKQLYNFMVSFYKALKKFHLITFFGKPFKENKYLAFEKNKLTDFSYISALQNSKAAKLICKYADNLEFTDWTPKGSFEITAAIQDLAPELDSISFDKLWEYIDVMVSMNLIEIVQLKSSYEPDYNTEYGYNYDHNIEISNFSLKINL